MIKNKCGGRMLWIPAAVAVIANVGSLASVAAIGQTKTGSTRPVRDPSRLKLARFHYRDLDHGKAVGTGTITIRRISDTGIYEFSNDVTLSEDFRGFRSQRWQATTSGDFAPIDATLAFVNESRSVPAFELHYSNGRVSGFAVDRKDPDNMIRHTVDDTVPVDTIDQRIDWAAAMASDLAPGRRYQFNVYDPVTGVSGAVERVGRRMNIHTPAGRFSTYQIVYEINKLGKLERYVAYATQRSPRFLVREDFPNGVITELTRIDD
jgi:hypothetical protein